MHISVFVAGHSGLKKFKKNKPQVNDTTAGGNALNCGDGWCVIARCGEKALSSTSYRP
jgi:hypothetical protein